MRGGGAGKSRQRTVFTARRELAFVYACAWGVHKCLIFYGNKSRTLPPPPIMELTWTVTERKTKWMRGDGISGGRNNLFLSHSDILVCDLGFVLQTEKTAFGIDVGCAKAFVANKRPSVFRGKHAEPFLLDTPAHAKSSLIQFGYKLWWRLVKFRHKTHWLGFTKWMETLEGNVNSGLLALRCPPFNPNLCFCCSFLYLERTLPAPAGPILRPLALPCCHIKPSCIFLLMQLKERNTSNLAFLIWKFRMCCPFQLRGDFLPTSWVQHSARNPTIEAQLLLFIYTISQLHLLKKSLWCKKSICNLPVFLLENSADENNRYVFRYYPLEELSGGFSENMIIVCREQLYILIISAASWRSAAEGLPHHIQVFR